MGEQENEKSKTKRITVYLTPESKREVKAYKDAMGYGTYASLFRQAFRVLKQVYPPDRGPQGPSLEDQLASINKKLDDLTLERKKLEAEHDTMRTRRSLLEERRNGIREERHALGNEVAEKTSLESFPRFGEIAEAIFTLLQDYKVRGGKGIKDLALMASLREEFPEEVVWATLQKLKRQGKLELKNGTWRDARE